ncbi:MAG: prolipoprotein diacylglyceryl transferase [Cardiobacteriaceae bacterium]|nr:prolipoprotein diacylglyceryl transferase [Cardiobacteriaceae bacterium]
MHKENLVGKIFYGSLFCVILPLILYLWTTRVNTVQLPVPVAPNIGIFLAISGTLLMLYAMQNLWKQGKGLPMNAWPPEHFVKNGAYRYLRHPIYVGAIMLLGGVALASASSAGLWFTCPIFTLLIVVYVLGLENDIIAHHFPTAHRYRPFLSLPPNSSQQMDNSAKASILALVFLPWLLFYSAFIFLGLPPDAFESATAWDNFIPLLPFTVLFYMVLYIQVPLLPWLLLNLASARRFMLEIWLGMALIFYAFLTIPAVVPDTQLSNNDIFTHLITLNRSLDGRQAAFPSFHVFWALIAARYYALRFPRHRLFFWLFAIVITLSCLTTRSHTLADVSSACVIYFIATRQTVIYRALLTICEYIANSWQEWRFGSIRLINHGFYAALGGMSGWLIMAGLLPNHTWFAWTLGISAFIGAALWAQWVEGSAQLLRPFGYYGSVIGMGLTALCGAIIIQSSIGNMLAIAALAACPIQFFGRCRCLVQGCCHGKPTTLPGIHFHHPKSRVHKLANWQGRNLHPTQLYSMLANAAIFFLLWRLLMLQVHAFFIVGCYLIFSGMARFVEEALRGEPQTPYWLGMRVYQWLALLTIACGMLFTTLPSSSLPLPHYHSGHIFQALAFAILILVVYGVDFPNSQKRFSRLTQD